MPNEQDGAERHQSIREGEPTSPTRAQADASRSDQEDPKVFVIERELCEVHLLLDNLSANPNLTLARLSGDAGPPGIDGDWVSRICQISWPPPQSEAGQAEQAALLIRAKDYLNILSEPASGSTIAFTLLVTQEGGERGEPTGTVEAPTRRSLAARAYPDLVSRARKFRLGMWWISGFLVFWLILTCAFSWYVASGNAALGDLAQARIALAEAQKRVDDAEAAAVKTDGTQRAAAPATIVAYCDQSKLLPQRKVGSQAVQQYSSVGQLQACRELDDKKAALARVKATLADWIRWSAPKPERIEEDVADAASLANILGSAVLPVMYGILGAGAAILRSLTRKTKNSLLAPRDLQLSLQQLALGAVVGACIGLFVSQPGAPGSADNSLLGPVALSGSAISFIAGFGVEAVFQALEALISRIFNIAPASSPARPDGPPAN